MEPSDFWKLIAEFSLQDQTKIDLRLSSFKKIGKLLEVMCTKNKGGPGLIDYQEDKKKGHKLVTKFYKEKLKDVFVPQFKLKRTKTKNEDGSNIPHVPKEIDYPKVAIEEVYQLGKNLEKLNNQLKVPFKAPHYGIKEVRDIINLYVEENELEKDARRGHVKLDPYVF